MKKLDLIKIFFFLIICAGFTSCTSLSKIKLAEHPGFEKNAQSYQIDHPYFQPLTISTTGYSSKTQIFTIENVQTKNKFKTDVLYIIEHEPEGLVEVLKRKTKLPSINTVLDLFFEASDSLENQQVEKRRDFFYQAMVVSNPFNNMTYLVLAKVYYLREIYVQPSQSDLDNSTIDISTISYPIDYWIFEGDKEIGFLSYDPSSIDLTTYFFTYTYDTFINDKLLVSQFHNPELNREVFIEYEGQLVAYFNLQQEPKGVFFGKRPKIFFGKAMIKKNLSKEFTADIFSTYFIADMVLLYIMKDPYGKKEQP